MYPARGLVLTSPFVPSKRITPKLGRKLSPLTSFLYTSLLFNLVAGNELSMSSEPRGTGEELGEVQEGTLASALQPTDLKLSKLHPHS